MKRVVVWVTVAAAMASACKDNRATRAETVTPAPGAEAVLAEPLLWAAEKAGKTTYLLGTMHMGIDAEARLPPVVWRALDGATAFAMETNLDDIATLIPRSPSSLRAALGEAYWAKLEAAFGADAARALDDRPPMVPAIELSLRGLPPTPVMDSVLAARALREHKPIVFLEPPARQVALLLKWMDVRTLKHLLDNLRDRADASRDMLASYAAGDVGRLVALSEHDKEDALASGFTAGEYAQAMNELLYDRNASWIAPIEQLHDGGGGFVAVGVMHLIGPRSVLELLAQRGFAIARVSADARSAQN